MFVIQRAVNVSSKENFDFTIKPRGLGYVTVLCGMQSCQRLEVFSKHVALEEISSALENQFKEACVKL